jgi:hypothetical protein
MIAGIIAHRGMFQMRNFSILFVGFDERDVRTSLRDVSSERHGRG